MAEHRFGHREGHLITGTCTTSKCIFDFDETPPKRFAADYQEDTNSHCSIRRCVASLRVLPGRFAPRQLRGWRVVPAAPPRPPLFLDPLSAFGLTPVCRLLAEACHG